MYSWFTWNYWIGCHATRWHTLRIKIFVFFFSTVFAVNRHAVKIHVSRNDIKFYSQEIIVFLSIGRYSQTGSYSGCMWCRIILLELLKFVRMHTGHEWMQVIRKDVNVLVQGWYRITSHLYQFRIRKIPICIRKISAHITFVSIKN